MSDDEDPFEELDDAVGDREGDPFESLDSPENESDQDESEDRAEPSDRPDTEQFREALDRADPSTPADGEESAAADSMDSESSSESPENGPFAPEAGDEGAQQGEHGPTQSPASETDSGMEFDVGRREETDEELLSDVGQREGDPFDSFGDAFEEMDVDKLDPDVVWQELASAESRGSVGDAKERTYAEVSKHSYCEGCQHFSPPPNVSCGHEGTEIVEFLDMETVRLVDCPVVTEREDLEDDDGFGEQ